MRYKLVSFAIRIFTLQSAAYVRACKRRVKELNR